LNGGHELSASPRGLTLLVARHPTEPQLEQAPVRFTWNDLGFD
jgi:hypothetical protein